jgi:hypothetical protein
VQIPHRPILPAQTELGSKQSLMRRLQTCGPSMTAKSEGVLGSVTRLDASSVRIPKVARLMPTAALLVGWRTRWAYWLHPS